MINNLTVGNNVISIVMSTERRCIISNYRFEIKYRKVYRRESLREKAFAGKE